MNDTDQAQQRNKDEEATSQATHAVSAGTSTSSAAYANRNQPTTSSLTQRNSAEDEEQVVTSTSSDNNNSGCTPYHSTEDVQDPRLHSLITSPARITSSTGNDCSSSPTQHTQTRGEAAHVLQSSEDDSSEQHRATTTIARRRGRPQQQELQQQENISFEEVMPTTSAAAAALAAGRVGAVGENSACNRLASQQHQEPVASCPSVNSACRRVEQLDSNLNKMVARDGGNNLAGVSSNTDQTSSHVENKKIILKLPKPALLPNNSESQHLQHLARGQQQQREQEHLADIDPATSNSCSNSSTNSSTTAEGETRRVEPLKINLHHGTHHHQQHHHSPSSSNAPATHVVPKITIKPLFKKSSDAVSADFKDESARLTNENPTQSDDKGSINAPIPKFTIKAATLSTSASGASCNLTGSESSEIHIVPKLTIRAAHEDGRSALTTSVVPKLTIKIADPQSAHGAHNCTHSPTTSKLTSGSSMPESVQQPPLPKLTIKTTLDGTSGSSIMSSSISPALSSSNSSSSAASSPHNVSSAAVVSSGSSTVVTSVQLGASAVPKLTIKTVPKGHEEPLAVPKLTIKTLASGSCVSSAETTGLENAADSDHASTSGAKIPKLTIKTGQEHAVIITQHSDDQTIPKLTIKTKSLDLEESLSDMSEEPPPPEKIPKLTIKTASVETPAAIPKLTISTPMSPKAQNAPLVVRQIATALTASSPKAESPERVPKLMISRQDVTVNHCASEISSEKPIPKLTIKTASSSNDRDDQTKEKPEKIPKFTIKTLAEPTEASQQSSEESEDALSVESAPSPQVDEPQHTNKLVPKLTIKNLGSPKLKLKSVLEETTRPEKSQTEPLPPAQKKSPKSAAIVTQPIPEVKVLPQKEDLAASNAVVVVANGGESSSSQEFCGFIDNAADSPHIGTGTKPIDHPLSVAATTAPEVVEPRRNSDDMDIDEGLQQHDPKIFNNLAHFDGIRNGESYGIHLNNDIDALPTAPMPEMKPVQSSQVVDTVDLTSSPSPSPSPAHFNYTDADPKIPELLQSTAPQTNAVANALLMECLQRETSVIQTMPRLTSTRPPQPTPKEHSNSLLLSQLTAPMKHPTPPSLQPRPPPNMLHPSLSTLRYPQLTERLMANGGHLPLHLTPSLTLPVPSASLHVPPIRMPHSLFAAAEKPAATVIDSIEILDTPEGSPRSSLEDSQPSAEFNHHVERTSQHLYMGQETGAVSAAELLRHNNNIMHRNSEAFEFGHAGHHKRHASGAVNDCLGIPQHKLRRTENHTSTMATLTILTNDKATNSATVITTSPTIITGPVANHCGDSSKSHASAVSPATLTTTQHRSRKQKHDHLLSVPIDERDAIPPPMNNDALEQHKNCQNVETATPKTETPPVVAPVQKKRGRPRRKVPILTDPPIEQQTLQLPGESTSNAPRPLTPTNTTTSAAERRVQLLRKRLAIDMVSAEQGELVENTDVLNSLDDTSAESPRRAVRATRRCATPNAEKLGTATKQQRKQRTSLSTVTSLTTNTESIALSTSTFNSFGGSTSSLSSACSSSSSYAATATTAAAVASVSAVISGTASMSSCNFSQIDLTMSSSSSSTSNGSTTATITTVGAGGAQSSCNSMLPPTKALSSTDPLPDVIFRSQDFSAIMLTQQLESIQSATSNRSSRANSQDDDEMSGGIGSGSGDDSMSGASPLLMHSPGRGRGRGRGRGSRGGAGRGATRGHRLGRGASALAKAIAMNRPRCVGGLKHTPDPQRMKGLFSPSPQVFEEDTRMSADFNPTPINSEPHTPTKPSDFLMNEDESQSSMISNTSVSILDPNTVAAVQNGASIRRQKKKKMEVCAADDADFSVASIAEYDWPPPKGCCPSKNRDTFMIQEQVANYLGIKSFKRKYPDLPRRQVDMEERNWLQEKGLVSEKMCDLGITAVWASDILDIMYADFYDKYEEYKEYIRQKHLREIESKQKALGLNVSGRGLQARDRAMLSASKWNAYFNKTRKDERTTCLDLQTLTVNVPLPADMPASTAVNRPIAEEIAKAASVERIPEPPTLLKRRQLERPFVSNTFYPVAIVPGQFTGQYKSYSGMELSCFPLNSVIGNPLSRNACKDGLSSATAGETDSANEIAETDAEASKQRSKIRRSRRARSERLSREKCDIKTEVASTTEKVEPSEHTDLQQNANAILDESDSDTGSSSDSSSSASSSTSEATSTSFVSSEDESDCETPASCSVCQRTQNCNLKDLPELFIQCYTCRRKVHPSCIEMPHRMVSRVRNYNWQCADCKCCIKCKRKQDTNKMLYCEQCDRGFHIYCLAVKSVPDGRWSCDRCSVCMRCGATKPEGLPQQQMSFLANGEKPKQVKHKKVKWINEYRIDHITKLREHCSMLCVPCGRARTQVKRIQIGNSSGGGANSNIHSNSLSPGITSNNTNQTKQQLPSPAAMQTSPSVVATTTTTMIGASSGTFCGSPVTDASEATTIATSTALPPPPVVA